MEWFIAVAAVGLVAVVLVGLFMGPSHGHTVPGRRRTHGHGDGHGHDARRRPARGAEAKSGTPQPPAPAPAEPPAYTLPPAPRRRPLARRPAGRRGGRRS